MRRLSILSSLVLTACFGGQSNPTGSASAAASSEPQVEALQGALTGARILEAKDLVKTGDAWAAALAKLERFLGKPTRVDGEDHGWAVIDGPQCVSLQAFRGDGSLMQPSQPGEVVTSIGTNKVNKDQAEWRDCVQAAGKGQLPAEDPSAAGPPSDGSNVPLETVLQMAIKGRSKWHDKRIKIAAQLRETKAVSFDNGVEIVTVHLVAGKDKSDSRLACALKDGASKPGSQVEFSPLVAEATLEVKETTDDAGLPAFKVSAYDCVITFDAAAAGAAPR